MKNKRLFNLAVALFGLAIIWSCDDFRFSSDEDYGVAFLDGTLLIEVVEPSPCQLYTRESDVKFVWSSPAYKDNVAAVFRSRPVGQSEYEDYWQYYEGGEAEYYGANRNRVKYSIYNKEAAVWVWLPTRGGNPAEGLIYDDGMGLDENWEPSKSKRPEALQKDKWYYFAVWSFNRHLKIEASSEIKPFCITSGTKEDCGDLPKECKGKNSVSDAGDSDASEDGEDDDDEGDDIEEPGFPGEEEIDW